MLKNSFFSLERMSRDIRDYFKMLLLPVFIQNLKSQRSEENEPKFGNSITYYRYKVSLLWIVVRAFFYQLLYLTLVYFS